MANSAALELILELQDSASKGLQHVQKELEGTSAKTGILQTALGFVGGGLISKGIDAVAGSIGGIASGMIGGNAEFETYNTQFGVLLKSSDDFKAKYKNVTDPLELQADAAKEAQARMADLADFGAKTPFELPEVVQADKILQGFGLHSEESAKKFGFSGKEILTIAGDLAAGTGADFTEISNDIGKLGSGATGEAISRFQELGIVTREELTKMGLQFSKSGELTSPLPQAMNTVLTAMKQKFGGMMDAQSATFEGMKSNLLDWVAGTERTIGAPIFDALKGQLGDVLTFLNSDAVHSAVDGFAHTLADGIGGAMNFLTGTAIPALIAGWDSIAPTIGTVVTAFQDAASALGTDGVGAALSTLGADLSELNPTIGAAIQSLAPFADTIMAVGAALLDAASSLGTDGFGAALSTMGADIAEVNPILGAFIQGLAPIGDALQTVSTSLANNGAQWAAIQDTMTRVSAGVTAVVMAVFGQLAVFLHAHGTEIQATIQTAWTQIQGIIQTAIQIIQATIVPALAAIARFIQAHGTEIQAILSAVWTTISTIISTTLAVLQGVLTATLQIIQGDWSGAWATIQATMQTVMNAIRTIVQAQLAAIQTIFASTWESIKTAVFNALNGLSQGVMSALNSMAQTIFSTLNSVAGTAASQAAAIGAGIISGIAGTILARAGEIANAAANAVTSAIDAAKSAVGIHSPSTVAAEEIGVPFVEGIAQGMDDATPALEQQANSLRDSLMAFMNDFGDMGVVFGDAFHALPPRVQEAIQQISDTLGEQGIGAFENFFNGVDEALQQLPPEMHGTVAMLRAEFEGIPTDAATSMTSLKSVFDRFLSDFGDWGQVFGPAFDALPTEVQAMVGQINDTLGSDGIGALQNYFNGFDDYLQQLPEGVRDTVSQLRDDLRGVSDATEATSADTQAAVDEMASGVEESTSALHDTVFAFFSEFGDTGQMLTDSFDQLPPQIQGVVEEISATLGDQGLGALENYFNGFDSYLSQLPEDVRGFVEQLRNDLNKVPGDVQKSTEAITAALEDQQKSTEDLGPEIGQLGGVVEETDTTVQDAVQAIQDGVPDAESAGRNLALGVKSGASSVHDELVSYARKIVRDMIHAMEDAAGIASPSQEAADSIGAPITQGIQQGMEGESDMLMTSAAAMTDDTVSTMADSASMTDVTVGSPMIQGVIDGLIAMEPDLEAAIGTLDEDSQTAFKKWLDAVHTLVDESFQSIIDQTNDLFRAVGNAADVFDPSKYADEVAAAYDKVATDQDKLAGTTQDLADAQTALSDATKQYNQDQQDLLALQDQKTALQAQIDSGQIDEATGKAQMKALDTQIADVQKDMTAQQKTQTEAQKDITDLTKQQKDEQAALNEQIAKTNDLLYQQQALQAVQQAEMAQIAAAQADAAKIVDPQEAAKYLQIQLDYIQKSADLQEQIIKAGDDADQIAFLKEQQALLDQNYQAQSDLLQYQMDTTQSTTEQVAAGSSISGADAQVFEDLNDTLADLNRLLSQGVPVTMPAGTTITYPPTNTIPDPTPVGGYASGTSSAPGGWSWVGEKGPELMYVPKGSQVYPSDASAGMMGGDIYITIDARGSTNVAEIEQAGYRGAQRALQEAGATAQIRKRTR